MMEQPTNTIIPKDPGRDPKSVADSEQIGEQVMSASTTQTSSTARPTPRKGRKRMSDRIAEASITVQGSRTDGKGTSHASSISTSSATSINFDPDPKYRRSMSAVHRMQETIRQKQMKYKEERESRRAVIDSLYEYIFVLLAHRLDLEYTAVVELVLDAPSFQDFEDFFSVGGRRSLIFFYQEAEVPGIECGRIIPGAAKRGKMMRLFLGSIDYVFEGLCLFFIRCNNHSVITKKNIHEELYFSVLDATEGLFSGISDLLSKAFLPVIKATDNWGHLNQSKHRDSEKQQFVEAIDQYLSHLLGVKQTIEGVVKLNSIESINFGTMQSFEGISAAASDEAVVARCEEALVVWYSQIHQVLLENEQVRREADDSGPVTELEHWIRIYMKLNFIIEQVKGENVKAVVVVLTMAKSKLIKMWNELDFRITNAANESKDNVNILHVLEQTCQPLYTLDMASMVRGIPKLLNAIQAIYSVSKYYQTSEHITSLFMK